MGRKETNKALSPYGQIQGNVLLSPTNDVYALYRLDMQDFPLNDIDFFKGYVEDGKGVFSHEEFDYHLFDVPEGYDIEKHIQKTMDKVLIRNGDVQREYWERAGRILKDEVHSNHYVQYLQVRLTKEVEIVNPVDFIQELWTRTKQTLKQTAGNQTMEKKPLQHYIKLEQMLFEDLQNYKKLDRVMEEEMNRILYYQFHRANQTPLSQVHVDAFNRQEGIVTNHKGYLTIEQLNKTHYISCLPVVETPEITQGSAFIQRLRDILPFAFETHAHLRFIRQERDLRQISKIRDRVYWQEKDREQTDRPLEEDDVLEKGEDALRTLQSDIRKDQFQLAKTTIFFVVYAESKEELDQRIKSFHYAVKPTAFRVYQPIVDQLTLFHQALPGTKNRFRLFEREMSSGYIWDMGLDLETQIGNRFGIPLGRVITQKKFRDAEEARGMSSKMFWFNPALTKKAIKGATATNGNTQIIGPPGSGKSVTVKYIFCWLPDLGQKVLYVDPKDETEDFFMRALDEYGHIPEFRKKVERINFLRLTGEEKNRGLLDPLCFLQGEEAETAACETLEHLAEIDKIPGTTLSKRLVIQRAVKKVMEEHPKKNLSRVLDEIRKYDSEMAEIIEGYDKTIGRVLFARDDSPVMDFSNPITVLGIAGLQLQTKEEIKEKQKPSKTQYVSFIIMENLYRLVSVFSKDRSQDAAIIYDEAGGMEDTASGQEKIIDSLRKGRANNTDVYLISQADLDVSDEKKKELISYKFMFKPKGKEAQKRALESLKLEINEENLEVIENLKQGTCLVQDHLDRTQPIVVDVLFEEWLRACSSTDKTEDRIQDALALEEERGLLA